MPPVTRRELTPQLLGELKKANVKILDAKTMRPISTAQITALKRGGGRDWGFSAWVKI